MPFSKLRIWSAKEPVSAAKKREPVCRYFRGSFRVREQLLGTFSGILAAEGRLGCRLNRLGRPGPLAIKRRVVDSEGKHLRCAPPKHAARDTHADIQTMLALWNRLRRGMPKAEGRRHSPQPVRRRRRPKAGGGVLRLTCARSVVSIYILLARLRRTSRTYIHTALRPVCILCSTDSIQSNIEP